MKYTTDLFREDRLRTAKSILFVILCLPAAFLLYDIFTNRLGLEPVEELTHRTGEWGLKLLIITLAVTPVQRLMGWSKLVRFRRMLGVFSFVYMLAHFSIYLVLDQFFYWPGIIQDIVERPYITVGFTCLILCLPLALTSTNGMMRRIGGKNWKRLHRLIYPAAIAAVLHFFWLVKADLTEPLIYALIVCVLLGFRLKNRPIRMKRAPATAFSI
ncbi:MAG: sulfoxide reductase heme-binding subunit YedZ [Parasphingorhabdus sp.]|jgi:sulfoxide reductase heme-binding subunit YedZ